MKALAILGDGFARTQVLNRSVRPLTISGVKVSCGLVDFAIPAFDADDPLHEDLVLLKVLGFTCNYRDKAPILKMATAGPASAFYVVGSEFVGEVQAAGRGVERLRVGDRVIGNNQWIGPRHWGGLPTTHASKEYLVLPTERLVRIPGSMPTVTAAAFSLGAQTAYSMLARLDLHDGANVLVTSAGSNTALFVINALRLRRANVYAVTTSPTTAGRLAELGVTETFQVRNDIPDYLQQPELRARAAALDGFDAVIDPFFDLHFVKVVSLIRFGGRYITCGFLDQYPPLTSSGVPDGRRFVAALETAIVRNLVIIGNCLGTTHDLQVAIEDYAVGDLDVVIDSVFGGDDAAPFLDRTFNASDRFGRVVFAHG